ncbi:MAG: translation initiation factor IF-3 [uncultured bacterium]|nr:MAG: translation initiation factor IF-3 [uncultured bacterium]OFW68881.1 MAG: translation initiation factor IF-3 [Alphaproteobacteria bacterium GWC2_42_16]OFW73624.1 MAG: translation initiation factor IF-3 [Alphaproteobacteria bacterium GWA2_41_27]OFW81939.1 MAG: translation initiation factor IF-3 [Alphaproteobacteria bacterium RIFCSPHIGHO2_12_FULL_42_100]OFW84956.1 MAG: translation initiation factor IF-3 [Alphaproteobacteria bacterium RBG_16_42_14]OFW91070.1 MAG: translation initiation fac
MKDDKGTASNGPRVNEKITSFKVRLVNENGEMLGILSQKEALEKAFQAGLDLVEVSPNADPPVCKILDYGKYRFEEQKRRAEMRKKQKVIEIKEIQLRPGIDKHDFEVKMRSARKFIEEGDKLKVTLRFRGRELSHQELGMDVLKRVKEALQDITKIEHDPKFEGKRVIMILAPLK